MSYRPPTWINEHVAVGRREDAADMPGLQRMGITGVLNVCRDLYCQYRPEAGIVRNVPIETMHVSLYDGHDNTPAGFLAALLCIRELLTRHPKILVHCASGKSRSVSIVAAWIAVSEGIDFADALHRVRTMRGHGPGRPQNEELAARAVHLYRLIGGEL